MAKEPGRNIDDSENSNYNPLCPQLKRDIGEELGRRGRTPDMENGWARNKSIAKKTAFFSFVCPYLSKPCDRLNNLRGIKINNSRKSV